jgi:hypothetical protein
VVNNNPAMLFDPVTATLASTACASGAMVRRSMVEEGDNNEQSHAVRDWQVDNSTMVGLVTISIFTITLFEQKSPFLGWLLKHTTESV